MFLVVREVMTKGHCDKKQLKLKSWKKIEVKICGKVCLFGPKKKKNEKKKKKKKMKGPALWIAYKILFF